MARNIKDLLQVPFHFTRRPSPLPADLRPTWRIALLVLLVEKCQGSRATLRQLHVLNWATRTPANRETFIRALEQQPGDLERPLVRVEPSLNRAIDLAIAEGLLRREADKVMLTDTGAAYVQFLWRKATDILQTEKQFLQRIKGKVTLQSVERALRWNEAQS